MLCSFAFFECCLLFGLGSFLFSCLVPLDGCLFLCSFIYSFLKGLSIEEFHLIHDYYKMPREKGEGERVEINYLFRTYRLQKHSFPSFLKDKVAGPDDTQHQ
jgi:hypothetical protein